MEERVFVEGPREIVPDVFVKHERPLATRSLSVAEVDEPLIVHLTELEIHESFVEIRDRQSRQLVTIIEIVSPSNRFAGSGLDSYLAKQAEVRHSQTHLVEIDLLRAGQHVLAIPEWVVRGAEAYDYLVAVNRARGTRDEFEIYPRRLGDRLPRIRIPLANGDADAALDLQQVLDQTYAQGSYGDRIDYGAACRPPLSVDQQAWAALRLNSNR